MVVKGRGVVWRLLCGCWKLWLKERRGEGEMFRGREWSGVEWSGVDSIHIYAKNE